MNVDDALDMAENGNWHGFDHLKNVARIMAAEIFRLREELSSVYKLGPHPVEQVTHIPLGDFVEMCFVPRHKFYIAQEECSRLRSEVALFKTEKQVISESPQLKFGLKEIKEFAENHEDERVRIIYRRLCEARSKHAKWCQRIAELENQIAHETKTIKEI